MACFIVFIQKLWMNLELLYIHTMEWIIELLSSEHLSCLIFKWWWWGEKSLRDFVTHLICCKIRIHNHFVNWLICHIKYSKRLLICAQLQLKVYPIVAFSLRPLECAVYQAYHINTQLCFRLWHFRQLIQSKYGTFSQSENDIQTHRTHSLVLVNCGTLKFKLVVNVNIEGNWTTLCRHQPSATKQNPNISHFNNSTSERRLQCDSQCVSLVFTPSHIITLDRYESHAIKSILR